MPSPRQALRNAMILSTLLGAPATYAAPPAGTFRPDANMARAKLPPLSTWDLSPLFASDAAFADGLKVAQGNIEKLTGFRGTLAQVKKLGACLALYFDTRLGINKLTLYANMRLDSHQGDAALEAQNTRALDTLRTFMAATTFIREEVMALSDKTLTAAYRNNSSLRALKPYLDELRRRRSRVLSPDAERVLGLAGDNLWAEIDLNEIPSSYEKSFGAMLTDLPLPSITDEQGKSVPMTLSNYGKYRASSDRRVRKQAVDNLFGSLRRYQHVLASTLAGQLGFNVFLARSRGYDTALAAYLDKDNIDTAVYHNLIRAVRANLGPLRDYLALRRESMKLDEVHIYDLYAPLVASVKMDVPFAEAREILPKALAPLGQEYVTQLTHGLDPSNGWIDVYPHAHKQSGAFSSSVYGVHPFVKMNYFDEVDDLSTLAHEYGHALHSHLSMTTQPYVTFNYATFVAEIASTCNEKLLSDYLVANAHSNAEKLVVLAELLETIRTTIYRQTLFAEFELRAHTAAEAGTPLTAEFFNHLYAELLRDYYGPGLAVGPDDEIEWAYIPHFYYKYYMYAYANGLSAGIALAERIQTRGEPAARDYLGMLKGGSSQPPLELLKGAGVDLTKPAAVEAAARLMQKTLDTMRQLRGK
ncbi:MAG: oligoendopeptidase F [Myxococcota bacterium]